MSLQRKNRNGLQFWVNDDASLYFISYWPRNKVLSLMDDNNMLRIILKSLHIYLFISNGWVDKKGQHPVLNFCKMFGLWLNVSLEARKNKA